MSHSDKPDRQGGTDTAPGDEPFDGHDIEGVGPYLLGLGLATLLTIVAFFISGTTLVWGPSIPVALSVLAIAQMGVHLAFFLHIGTGPDSINNVMAPGVRGADRAAADCRVVVDHVAPEPQHGADGPDHADAALRWSFARCRDLW